MSRIPNPTNSRGTSFDAFISYARSASTASAAALQPAIERCAKAWHQKRSCHIFRDDSSMSADPSLWGTIEEVLHEVHWLILIVSPAAAASRGVNREIEWWAKNKDADHIILVHERGTIEWDEDAADFSSVAYAIPPALRVLYPS